MTGRNEPCPCGSGKKFKKCCGISSRDEMPELPSDSKLGFASGTYKISDGYAPAIICISQTKTGEQSYHFVMVKNTEPYSEGQEYRAAELAYQDQRTAFLSTKDNNSPIISIQNLKSMGYYRRNDCSKFC
jgi:hypothetical protein